MEANEERVETSANLPSKIPPTMWVRTMGRELMGFAAAFSWDNFQDLISLTRLLPGGVVVCDSSIVAGVEHLEQILFQANDFWLRNGELARKKSIDLLMRITCQRQINDAIALSKISETKGVVIFGIVKSLSVAEDSLLLLTSRYPAAKRNDALIELDREKVNSLRKMHHLPRSFGGDRVRVALKEKSALLVFSN